MPSPPLPPRRDRQQSHSPRTTRPRPGRRRQQQQPQPQRRTERREGEEEEDVADRGDRVGAQTDGDEERTKRRKEEFQFRRSAQVRGVQRSRELAREREGETEKRKKEKEKQLSASSARSSNALSMGSLAKLDAWNEKTALVTKKGEREGKVKERGARAVKEKERERERERERDRDRRERRRRSERLDSREKRRVVSGPLAEEGKIGRNRNSKDSSGSELEEEGWSRRKKRILGAIGVLVLILAIFIPVGVVVSKKKNTGNGNEDSSGGGGGAAEDSEGPDPLNENLKTISETDIPASAKGSVLDPFKWYDTTDFNITYTAATVGGLSLMGLNSTWTDTAQANPHVPPLNAPWPYGHGAGKLPIRGVNLGGWLSIEPFITPSLFNAFKPHQGVVDEYTLCFALGPAKAAQRLERHYAHFVTEQTFAEIQAAGLDHVRIPFSYWALTTYADDPYVPHISWRYLLRGIEWARRYGLRINLDVHGLPGSQNGWNHSGRLGAIGWLNGTDGALNAQRSLDLHKSLSTFFAQPRYRNVIAIYGLVNEPKMSALDVDEVVAWTTSAVKVVRDNGITQPIAFGDGFLGLLKWQGKLQGVEGLVLDAHQYTIFNPDQIVFTHQKKIEYACTGWSDLFEKSMDPSTG